MVSKLLYFKANSGKSEVMPATVDKLKINVAGSFICYERTVKMLGCRGGSRAAATSKMERFVIIVNGFQPLTIITKHSILDIAAALGSPLGWLSTTNFLLHHVWM